MKQQVTPLLMSLIVLSCAVTPCAAGDGIASEDVLNLYFGSAPREVGLFPPESAPGGYIGPTSFTVDTENNIYLLDAAHCSVKKYSPDGILQKVIEYPPFSLDGKPVLCVDVAVSGDGTIFVANQTENVVWKFSDEGALLGTVGEKAPGESHFGFLVKIHVDAGGALYGADRQTMKVLKFDPSGKKARALPFTTSIVTTPDGSLVMLDVPDEASSLSIKRLSPDFSEVKHVATLKPPKTVLDAYPIGADGDGNLFVFSSLGIAHGDFWRKVEQLLVAVVSPAGKVIRKIALPAFPAFPLNRHFAITPDGRLLTVETDEERFRIIEYK